MATLTTKARKALPKAVFAIPATRSYPIQDIAHARVALSRVAANGTPAQKAQVKAAVYRRYPQLNPATKSKATGTAKKKATTGSAFAARMAAARAAKKK